MSLNSIKQKNLIKKEPDFLKWAAEVHRAEAEEKLKKEGEVETTTDKVVSGDENEVYNDENVIVFLANNINDPKQSVRNCIKYGKGSSLCISGNSARSYYHSYRWEDRLTTYFVWLKDKNKYMLVDVGEDGHYQYNNIYDNHDRKATTEQIIQKYPVLQKPFDEGIFESVPIEGKELDFYERYYEKNISDFDNLEDRVNFASFNDIDDSEWKNIPENELKIILQTYIESSEDDIPEYILNKFPSLEKRYWQKIKQRLEIEIEQWGEDDEMDFTPHEKKILIKDKDVLQKAFEKIPQLKKQYDDYQKEIEDINSKIIEGKYNGEIVFVSFFPLNLPQLQESGNINAPSVTEINLPQLQESGNINAPSVTEINLPQLQTSGTINVIKISELNLPNLKNCFDIYSNNATEINLPQLQTSKNMNFPKVKELNLIQLQKSGIIYTENATRINLPQLRTSGNINAPSITELNLPQLQKSGYINIKNANEINLPQLKESYDIVASNLKELNLPQLQTVGSIDIKNATSIDLKNLETCVGRILAEKAVKVDLGKLKNCRGNIRLDGLTTIDLKNLEICGGYILSLNAKNIDLQNLKSCAGIDVKKANILNLGKLQVCEYALIAHRAEIVNLRNLKRCNGSIELYNLKESIDMGNLEFCLKDININGEIENVDMNKLKECYGMISIYAKSTIDLRSLNTMRHDKEIFIRNAKKLIIPPLFESRLYYPPRDMEIINPKKIVTNESIIIRFKEFVANKYL
jgi:hypothetical protein